MSAIPVEVEPLLLPSPKLSILELLHHHIPLVASVSNPSLDPTKLFTSDPPNIFDISHISQVPIPPQKVFITLRDHLPQSEKHGKQSVTCPHSNISAEKAYPLWIITYWERLEPIRKIRDAWLLAEDYLVERSLAWKGKGNQEGVDIVNKIFNSLSVIPWSDKLHGFTKDAGDDLFTISLFASTRWIKDEQANQMLDLLRKEIRRTRIQSVEIQSTWFFEKLATGCDEQARYISESSFRYHRHLGHSLATGIYDRVGTLVNFRRNHWVPVVIDFRKQEILYGDSLGAPAPQRVKLVLTWWTQFHSGDVFTYRNLDITLQNDSFSCGLLSYNALLVHFMGSEALIAATDVAKGRLCILQKIMNEHQSRLNVSR